MDKAERVFNKIAKDTGLGTGLGVGIGTTLAAIPAGVYGTIDHIYGAPKLTGKAKWLRAGKSAGKATAILAGGALAGGIIGKGIHSSVNLFTNG